MLRILLAGLLVFGAGQALAAPRTAQPPPSGVVVHLFGPQGVWANVAPMVGGTQEAPVAAAPAGGPPTSEPATVASSAAPTPESAAPAPAAASYPEPTLGAVLHQMFVTGDPNAGPGFPQGRKGN